MVFVKGDLWWGSNSLSKFKAFIFLNRFKKLSLFFSTLVFIMDLSSVSKDSNFLLIMSKNYYCVYQSIGWFYLLLMYSNYLYYYYSYNYNQSYYCQNQNLFHNPYYYLTNHCLYLLCYNLHHNLYYHSPGFKLVCTWPKCEQENKWWPDKRIYSISKQLIISSGTITNHWYPCYQDYLLRKLHCKTTQTTPVHRLTKTG